jgi:hypothetical protein
MNSGSVLTGSDGGTTRTVRRIGNQRDRIEIALRLEGEALVERGVGGEADAGNRERIAIRLGAHHRERAEVGVGAWPVDDQEGLAKALVEAFAEQPRQELGAAAGRERHDQLDRARGIVLRARRPQ